MTQPATPADEHLWTPAEWDAIVRDAVEHANRINAGALPRETPHRMTAGALPLDGVVVARRHGGARPAPTFGVIHSAETPLTAGYAAAIARMFATTTVDKSCHYMTDPAETWGVLDDLLVAWHCGNGNTNSVGLEQSGRAAMTREQWLAGGTGGPGYSQLRRNAAVIRALHRRHGIVPRWLTDEQLRQAHRRQPGVTGWATHDQCRRVLGGTTHTDPGGGFPTDVQMELAAGAALEEEDLAMADAASLEKQLAQIGQSLTYVVGQLQGQEKDKDGDTGWLAADGQARTLVDLTRGAFAHARTAATRTVTVDTEQVAAAVVKQLGPQLAAAGAITTEDVRAAVQEGLASLVLAAVPEQSR